MNTSVAPRTPAADARWELARTVAASTSFHRSPRLRELLLYICERTVQNRQAELREQQIGCAVFGRKPDYNPGEDNIVRVEIRQLRKRLEEYFATEGKDEPFVIVIPKGAYIPMFDPRACEPVAAQAVPAVEAPKVDRKPWTVWLQPAIIAVAGRSIRRALADPKARAKGRRTGLLPVLQWKEGCCGRTCSITTDRRSLSAPIPTW